METVLSIIISLTILLLINHYVIRKIHPFLWGMVNIIIGMLILRMGTKYDMIAFIIIGTAIMSMIYETVK